MRHMNALKALIVNAAFEICLLAYRSSHVYINSAGKIHRHGQFFCELMRREGEKLEGYDGSVLFQSGRIDHFGSSISSDLSNKLSMSH